MKSAVFSARYSPAVTKVTKGLRSKEVAKSIFTTGLYFLLDSATHISFYFKQHFFFERLQIFRYSAYIGLPYNLQKLASKSRTQTSKGEM